MNFESDNSPRKTDDNQSSLKLIKRFPSNMRNDKYLPLQNAIEEEKTEEDI